VISATQQSDLSFQVGGLINELPVNESDTVEPGAIIARLDARDFESNVNSARASYTNAEDEYQRAARLREQDAIAQSVLEQRQSQRDVARAQLESAEKALQDSVLRAPYAGVVASVPVRRLQTVSAGTSIATVISLELLDATINLPASVIAQVPTREERGVVVLLEAASGQEIEATFREASLVADATSQTYAVTFSFSPPDNLLVLPGMNAIVVLHSTGSTKASSTSVAVPLAAVQSDGNGQFVWRVDPTTMTVSKQPVGIEQGIGETVIVTTGLASGDQIVGAGAAYLADGMQVTPWTE
jgi:RND family efflux transporter MFP subunit